MKKLIAMIMIVILLLSACSNATLDGAGKELEDAVANVSDADNRYVQMVKGGYRESAPDLTYEDAFSAFFGTPRWKYFEGENGQDVVEFTGDCIYRDVNVKARIQFIVDEDKGTFEATYLAFNEVPQDALTLAAVIGKAFEEAEASGTGDNKSGLLSGADLSELSYQGISLIDLLGCAPVQLYEKLGAPTSGTPVDGDSYLGGEYYGYDGMMFIIDYSTAKIAWIMGAAEAVEVNGVTLDKSRTELMEILGTPLSEDNYYDETGDSDAGYLMEYLDKGNGVSLLIEMPDADSNSNRIMLSIYDDDVADDYWDDSPSNNDSEVDWEDNDALLQQNEYYVNSDPDLYGRWRASDGSSIEFYEGGTGNMSFCLWSQDQLGKCDSIMWQANNGYLSLEPYFSYRMNYEYTPKSEETPFDYISLPIWGRFYRVQGTEGDSIVGSWAIGSVASDHTSLGLYEDGTGYWYGHDAYYWDANDTALMICIRLQVGCDYYVAGDMLELFFSNGSMIFTRVGN